MRVFLNILILVMLVAVAGAARAADWVVGQVSQPARYTTDRETWRELGAGMAVPDASWIHTGPRGRLLLARAGETILFKPETMASIVSRSGARPRTDIGQQFGSLVLEIEKRSTAHTTVHTPYLAAVVKGTRFEVAVGRNGARVNVEEGTVEVTDLGRGERVDVRVGQSVGVAADAARGTMTVQGPGAKAQVGTVRATPPAVRANPAAASVDVTGTAGGGIDRAGTQAPEAAADRSSVAGTRTGARRVDSAARSKSTTAGAGGRASGGAAAGAGQARDGSASAGRAPQRDLRRSFS